MDYKSILLESTSKFQLEYIRAGLLRSIKESYLKDLDKDSYEDSIDKINKAYKEVREEYEER